MPEIPFPNVPAYPGVPALIRPVSTAIASVPALAIALGAVETLLINALQQAPQWASSIIRQPASCCTHRGLPAPVWRGGRDLCLHGGRRRNRTSSCVRGCGDSVKVAARLTGRCARRVAYFRMFFGDPGRSPTCDLRVRSALLYATELLGHCHQFTPKYGASRTPHRNNDVL